MKISYKVRIVEVNTNGLLVEFSAENASTRLVGTPLVPTNVTPAEFFRRYAPISDWEYELTPKQNLQVGAEIADEVTVGALPAASVILPMEVPTLTLTADSL